MACDEISVAKFDRRRRREGGKKTVGEEKTLREGEDKSGSGDSNTWISPGFLQRLIPFIGLGGKA